MRTNFQIYFTNDVHSYIPDAIPTFEHLCILKEKQNSKQLFIDLGDFFEGHPFFDEFEGKPETLLLDSIYDIAIPGNHGFKYFTSSSLKNTSKLNCNILNSRGEFIFDPYKYIYTDIGIMCIIGIMSVEAFNSIEITERSNLIIEDPLISISKVFHNININPDFFILLSHGGIQHDIKLAEHINKFNVIISSHCHSSTMSAKINNTLIVKSLEYGQGIGYLNFYNNKITFKNIIKRQRNGIAHKNIVFLYKYVENFRKKYSKTYIRLDNSFNYKFDTKEKICNLVGNIFLEYTYSDIAIINSTSIRGTFKSNIITRESFYQVFPFKNYIVSFYMMPNVFLSLCDQIDSDLGVHFVFKEIDLKSPLKITTTSFLFTNYFSSHPYTCFNKHCKITTLIYKYLKHDIDSSKNT